MVRPSTTNSIKQKTLKNSLENPQWKAKQICRCLDLEYKYHGSYVNNLLSNFKSNDNFGSPLEPHHQVFVWESVPRSLLFDCLDCVERDVDVGFRAFGWETTSNRNRMFVFRDERGSVHWYKSGKGRLYLRGSVKLTRAKELFWQAFRFLDDKTLSKIVDAPLRIESRHWVFNVGAPVPAFDIMKFRGSHGIRVYVDKSHSQAAEVEESLPFWLSDFQVVVSMVW